MGSGGDDDSRGAGGRALVYTLETVRAAPVEVVQELLSQPDVKLALVIDVNAELVPGAGEPAAVIVGADRFAHRLVDENLASVLDDLFISGHGGAGGEQYELDFKSERLIIAGSAGGAMMHLAASGIQLPSPKIHEPVRLRYRCTDPQHHIVWREAHSSEKACGEALADGRSCPGTLERF